MEWGGKIKIKTLFNIIKKNAKSVIGVDIESSDIEIINGNVKTIKLNKKFYIIVAGDLIEQLCCPRPFLNNICLHLKDKSSMISVTLRRKRNKFNYLFRLIFANHFLIVCHKKNRGEIFSDE